MNQNLVSESKTKLAQVKHRKFVKPGEVVLIVAFVIIVVVLLKVLIGDLALKHEVTQATAVSDKAVAAMQSQNSVALRALGNKQFKADHTAAELSDDLTFKTTPPVTFAQMYSKNGKRTIAEQSVTNNSRGQHVVVIYRYDKLKAPIFVRIDTIKPPASGQWYLQALSVSPDESSLLE